MTKTMLKSRRLCFALAVAAALCFGATAITRADPIYVTLLEPTQTGTPGGTITFRGNVYNAGPPQVTLSSYSWACDGPCTFSRKVGAVSLDELQTSGEIDLFTVTISPDARPTDNISGFFIAGDGDRGVFAGAANFRVNISLPTAPQPVPEPATLVLLGTGLAGAAAKARATATPRVRRVKQGREHEH